MDFRKMKILLLDNYDSFTYNLVHLVEQFDDVEVYVHRNNEITVADCHLFDKIILSPGPGLPCEAGILNTLIREMAGKKSMFGVCLGMQAMAEVFGATLLNLEKVQHGIASDTTVTDHSEIIFKSLPPVFRTGRYHSWIVNKEKLPECLHITSVDSADNMMSLRHATHDICGVQFHPESVLTEYGKEIMENWLMS
jgi:anthranilate synthase component 2